jgi:hypothetical protein
MEEQIKMCTPKWKGKRKLELLMPIIAPKVIINVGPASSLRR